MQSWTAQRPSVYGPGFLPSLEAVGVSTKQWDTIAPEIETVLCGCTDAALDAGFPTQVGNVRIVLTEAARGVSALRIAFIVEPDDRGKGRVVYMAGGIR